MAGDTKTRAARHEPGREPPAARRASGRRPSRRASPGPAEVAEVEALAARGLTPEEIGVRLGHPPDWPDAAGAAEIEAAVRRGRARGRAALKEALYEAALEGKVTSLTHMLTLLREPERDDPEATELEVERVIIGRPDEEG